MNDLQQRVFSRIDEEFMKAKFHSTDEDWYLEAWSFLYELWRVYEK